MSLSNPPQSPTDATPPSKPADANLATDSAKEKKAPPALKPADDQNLEQGSSRSKGFDPYNSGAFDRRQTWEKVTRK